MIDTVFDLYVSFLQGFASLMDFIFTNEVLVGLLSGATLAVFLGILITKFFIQEDIMFAFFANLFYSLFVGEWTNNTLGTYLSESKNFFDSLPLWNMFNHSENIVSNVFVSSVPYFIAFVVGTIFVITLFMIVAKAVVKILTFWR